MINMTGINYVKIAKLIGACPKCSNPILGRGYGSLMIEGHYITRKCACGYHFKHDMREGKKTADLQQAIKKSLSRRGRPRKVNV